MTGGKIQWSESIVVAGDPVLRNPAAPVAPELLGTPELRALIDAMVLAMRNAPGVGLAAPQLGVPLRVLVLEDTADRMSHLSAEERAERARDDVPLTAIVNPVLELLAEKDEPPAIFFEGCLSVPGYTALTPRAHAVRCSGVTPEGEPIEMKASGWPARILQHECDHLDGTLYVDRMISRSLCTAEAARTRWSGKSLQEVAEALQLRRR